MDIFYVILMFVLSLNTGYSVENYRICKLNYFMQILTCFCDDHKLEIQHNKERKQAHLKYAVDHCCKYTCSELFLSLFCQYKSSDDDNDDDSYVSEYAKPEYSYDKNIIVKLCTKELSTEFNRALSTEKSFNQMYFDIFKCATSNFNSNNFGDDNLDKSVNIPDDEDYSLGESSGFSNKKDYADELSGFLSDNDLSSHGKIRRSINGNLIIKDEDDSINNEFERLHSDDSRIKDSNTSLPDDEIKFQKDGQNLSIENEYLSFQHEKA